jgi:hypothetical protein
MANSVPSTGSLSLAATYCDSKLLYRCMLAKQFDQSFRESDEVRGSKRACPTFDPNHYYNIDMFEVDHGYGDASPASLQLG